MIITVYLGCAIQLCNQDSLLLVPGHFCIQQVFWNANGLVCTENGQEMTMNPGCTILWAYIEPTTYLAISTGLWFGLITSLVACNSVFFWQFLGNYDVIYDDETYGVIYEVIMRKFRASRSNGAFLRLKIGNMQSDFHS